MRAVSLLAFIFALALSKAAGQVHNVDPIFAPALAQVRGRAPIPVLLPLKWPDWLVGVDHITFGKTSEDGYEISIWERGQGAGFVAGFSGSRRSIPDLKGTRVVLAGGQNGIFRPVSCGGSCAPANLWWQQEGIMYHIQILLNGFDQSEDEQERILVEVANSAVVLQNKESATFYSPIALEKALELQEGAAAAKQKAVELCRIADSFESCMKQHGWKWDGFGWVKME